MIVWWRGSAPRDGAEPRHHTSTRFGNPAIPSAAPLRVLCDVRLSRLVPGGRECDRFWSRDWRPCDSI